MAKKSKGRKGERLRREDPDRVAPHRTGSDHIKRNATSRNAKKGNGPTGRPNSLVSETVQQAISEMVQLSSTVIEEQIRAGQTAAARLRDGIANSKQLNTDVNLLVEGLVATTKDVGATWLDLLLIAVRSIGTKPPDTGGPGSPTGGGTTPPTTITRTGTSNGATTISSLTPADPAIPAEPPQIAVTGSRVKSVTLDLRPPSPRFVPLVRELLAGDPKRGLTAVKFQLTADRTHLVLTVNVLRGQPAGTYTGVIVDSSTNEPGGMVSVTVGS
jgi:hypothetical protein